MSESTYQDWERSSKVDFDRYLKIILEGEAGYIDRKNLVTCLAARKQTVCDIDKECLEM